MGMFRVRGSTKRTQSFLEKMSKPLTTDRLDSLARAAVTQLALATPTETGKTASMWSYEIEKTSTKTIVHFNNDNVINGVNIAVILQYGHGTGTGGYVQGRDYINPVLQPVFDAMAEAMWKEVTSA